MKIVSWNVNGIRACHRKGEFLSLLDRIQPDLLCIQETKAWPEQLDADLLSDHGYFVTWAQAEKKGYSGVATFCRTKPSDVQVGLDIERFDREGRVIITRHGTLTGTIKLWHRDPEAIEGWYHALKKSIEVHEQRLLLKAAKRELAMKPTQSP